MKFWLPLLVVLVFISGCGTYPLNSTATDKQNLSLDSFSVIKSSDIPYDDLNASKSYLVYYSDNDEDIKNFNKEYFKLTGEVAPKFEGVMVIAKQGQKNSGGYGIEVESVSESNTNTQINLILKSPGKNCLVTAALTNPFIIIYIPNNYKEIVFTKKHIQTNCQ